MAASPVPSSSSIISVTVTVAGSPLPDSVGIESVNITHAVNKISVAELLLQGEVSPDDGTFPISDAATFVPGAAITIALGYDSTTEVVFTGIVMKHSIEVDADSGYRMRVQCKHKAVLMTYQETEAMFATKLDSAIISSIVGTYSGLSATVTATTGEHAFVFQRLSTDWDFILARAEFNGFLVVPTSAGALTIAPPTLSGTSVLRLALGEGIFSFSGEINAEDQPSSVAAFAWDAKTQANITSTAAEPTLNAQGNITPKSMSTVPAQKALKLITSTPMTTAELKTWADGVLLRKRLSAIRGSVKFIGSTLAKPDTLVDIEGVGARFNGVAYVSQVTHSVANAEWTTTVKIGLEDSPISKKTGFSNTAAGGQLPAIHGLQVGQVKKLSADPGSETRIQVALPSNATTSVNVWARFANFYASNNAGSGFIPEVNDEVIVGFIDADPRYPVVLGSLYSSKNVTPNAPADEKNNIKSITTRSKLKISFDDDKKIVKIETPGGNSVTISDEDKGMELKDQNGNSIKLSSDGIVLNSAKDITLKATGGINLSATAKVDIKATQDLALAGLNINANAQVGFVGKGAATAEVSASGQTTIKGAIVMIN